MVATIIVITFFLAPICCRPLNYIPIPVLNGLFLYLAVTALSGQIQLFEGTKFKYKWFQLQSFRKSVVRTDHTALHGTNCLSAKPLYQVSFHILNVIDIDIGQTIISGFFSYLECH